MKKRYMLIAIAFILFISDLIILENASLGEGVDLAGRVSSVEESENAGFRTLYLGFPFISIIIGSIVALFLSKNKKYNDRFIDSSLICLISLYGIMMILGIRNLILW